jgi:hypothetical protein
MGGGVVVTSKARQLKGACSGFHFTRWEQTNDSNVRQDHAPMQYRSIMLHIRGFLRYATILIE